MGLARMASPAFHVDGNSPPMLCFHGLADTVVLPDQACRIADVYRQNGLPHELHMIPGGGHGGGVFLAEENQAILVRFLRKYL